MTKRIVIGVVCVALSALLGVLGWIYMKYACVSLESSLSSALDSENEEMFLKAVRAAEEWEKREKLVGILIKHSDADSLDKLYMDLTGYAEEKNPEMTAYYLRLCISEINVLMKGEKPGWENVF